MNDFIAKTVRQRSDEIGEIGRSLTVQLLWRVRRSEQSFVAYASAAAMLRDLAVV